MLFADKMSASPGKPTNDIQSAVLNVTFSFIISAMGLFKNSILGQLTERAHTGDFLLIYHSSFHFMFFYLET